VITLTRSARPGNAAPPSPRGHAHPRRPESLESGSLYSTHSSGSASTSRCAMQHPARRRSRGVPPTDTELNRDRSCWKGRDSADAMEKRTAPTP